MSVRTEGDGPVRKVTAAGVAGATTVVAMWAAENLFGMRIPPEVGSAVTTILAFAASYLTPPGENEKIVRLHAARIA